MNATYLPDIPLSVALKQGHRWGPDCAFDEVLSRLQREALGLPAVPQDPADAAEVEFVEKTTCRSCGQGPREIDEKGHCPRCCDKESEHLEPKSVGPLPRWPKCWSLRAILDLERISGLPLQKAQALVPLMLNGG